METVIGIDLGTTNSGVAIWKDGRPRMIKDADGNTLTPSVVTLHPEQGEWLVGHEAERVGARHPLASIYSIKRFMGRRFGDRAIQDDLDDEHILYQVEDAEQDQAVTVVVDTHHLSPQQVSAKILRKLKEDAESALEERIGKAVITVPAYFNEAQRQATRDAGVIAGLEVLRVVNEPTAACLAFAYDRLAETRRTVAVYDLGGGTFDISLLEIGRGPFRVLATNGNTHLGGDDIDWAIVEWFLAEQPEEVRRELGQDRHALARLRILAEEVKIALSDETEVEMAVEGPLTPNSDVTAEPARLTRAALNELAADFIEATLDPCRIALHDAGLHPSEVEEVLLVGGQTRMPAIFDAVADFFGRPPDNSVNPDEVVALGAAVQAGVLADQAKGIKLADVVPLSLGVSVRGGMMNTLIPRNTAVPITAKEIYSTAEDYQDAIEVNVYQGEYKTVDKNVFLGRFSLVLLEKLPKGKPQIEVTFAVDESGILDVSARDLRGGELEKISITDSVRLSDAEIARMVAEAEAAQQAAAQEAAEQTAAQEAAVQE